MRLVVFVCVFLVIPPLLAASEDDTSRTHFLAAERALERGDIETFERLESGLKDYVLYPYLEYAFMRRYLGSRVDDDRVTQFLQRWPDSPLADHLRDAWLEKLADRGQWERFIALWEPVKAELASDSELSCNAGRALLATNHRDEAYAIAERLWMNGKSQPAACDSLFDAWIKAGNVDAERARQRIALAMDARNPSLTRYLEQFLPARERPWIARWRRMYSHPERELAQLADAAGEWPARLFAFGVRRLASHDPDLADQIWRERADHFELDDLQRNETARAIALVLAWRHNPLALDRLSALPAAATTKESEEWRVRMALWQMDWKATLAALDAMNEFDRSKPDWLYWRARAVEALGDETGAQALYQQAADCRCFYGFLASERVGLPPSIDTVPLQVSEEELSLISDLPAMRRAHELHMLGMEADARREWRDATRNMPAERLRSAAKLAERWGWYDQAILTLGRTEFLQDLEVRFPTPFVERVQSEAEQRELDTAFIYAVMRQESAFYPNARSRVGALGLMQLMPTTARRTGRQIKHPVRNRRDILDVDNNIRLGTAHLRQLMDRYDGNRLYTMAAYNAGVNRVEQWLPKNREVPGDVWVASMPFGETREYVKRIFAYTIIYEWRLGHQPTPLSIHLPKVSPTEPPTRLTGDGSGAAS